MLLNKLSGRQGKHLTLLHSEQPKLDGVLAVLSVIGFRRMDIFSEEATLSLSLLPPLSMKIRL